MLRVHTVGEFGLIDLISKTIRSPLSVIKGIGDDAAVVPHSSLKYSLLTTDMLIEGVHFTKRIPSRWIGHKALACNMSDIAAMGGRPKYALVSLGIPPQLDVQFVLGIYRGMKALAEEFDIQIVGGDTNKSPKIIINIALVGEVNKKHLVLRKGARPGDQIFTTGPLGRSLSSGWHFQFVPRLRESQFLVKFFHPTAMIDISDGLASDLGHILKESSVGARLFENRIPLRKNAVLKDALYDGEDFELILTMPNLRAQRLLRQKTPFPFYWIGEIRHHREGFFLENSKGQKRPLKTDGFVHF